MRLIVIIFSVMMMVNSGLYNNCVSGHVLANTPVHHIQTNTPDTNGFWEKNITWKSRWVKSWTTKKYYIPIWKKVWGPIIHDEWIPLPKPPPGWLPHKI